MAFSASHQGDRNMGGSLIIIICSIYLASGYPISIPMLEYTNTERKASHTTRLNGNERPESSSLVSGHQTVRWYHVTKQQHNIFFLVKAKHSMTFCTSNCSIPFSFFPNISQTLLFLNERCNSIRGKSIAGLHHAPLAPTRSRFALHWQWVTWPP